MQAGRRAWWARLSAERHLTRLPVWRTEHVRQDPSGSHYEHRASSGEQLLPLPLQGAGAQGRAGRKTSQVRPPGPWEHGYRFVGNNAASQCISQLRVQQRGSESAVVAMPGMVAAVSCRLPGVSPRRPVRLAQPVSPGSRSSPDRLPRRAAWLLKHLCQFLLFAIGGRTGSARLLATCPCRWCDVPFSKCWLTKLLVCPAYHSLAFAIPRGSLRLTLFTVFSFHVENFSYFIRDDPSVFTESF